MRNRIINEEEYKQALVGTLRTRYPYLEVLRHEDKFTAGVPDISITRRFVGDHIPSLVLWLEAKVGPGARLKTQQHHRLHRLGGFYVVWDNVTKDSSLYCPWRGRLAFGEPIISHEPDLEVFCQEIWGLLDL